MKADATKLVCLKALLDTFVECTRLKVNYHKSMMIPINVSGEKLEHLAKTFGCQSGTMPFTYLGLPLGTSKPKFQDLTPIMDRMERSLAATSCFLSYTR